VGGRLRPCGTPYLFEAAQYPLLRSGALGIYIRASRSAGHAAWRLNMMLRIVETDWGTELRSALKADHTRVCIVTPFIKREAAKRLFGEGDPDDIRLLTRFNLKNFGEGVSDTDALRLLLERGAHIRGVKHLHAKVYLLGAARVMVTSANLTEAALTRNYEFGFVAEEPDIVSKCERYFETMWSKARPDLTFERLSGWEEEIGRRLAGGTRPSPTSDLGDEGVDIGASGEPPATAPAVDEAPQTFVKFFGKSDNRALHSVHVFDEVARSGSHWACTYPRNRRPRQVQDGAVMFMGRMVRDPDDILVFGRAIGMSYGDGADDASPEDIQDRPWKADWPRYIRVHHPVFVSGELSNGVSLYDLMDDLGSNAFASTQRNAFDGQGKNTNPRNAYPRHPHVELSPEGHALLNERLERALAEHGPLDAGSLNRLDWPDTTRDAGSA
jgi:phospholipase D-like protein